MSVGRAHQARCWLVSGKRCAKNSSHLIGWSEKSSASFLPLGEFRSPPDSSIGIGSIGLQSLGFVLWVRCSGAGRENCGSLWGSSKFWGSPKAGKLVAYTRLLLQSETKSDRFSIFKTSSVPPPRDFYAIEAPKDLSEASLGTLCLKVHNAWPLFFPSASWRSSLLWGVIEENTQAFAREKTSGLLASCVPSSISGDVFDSWH